MVLMVWSSISSSGQARQVYPRYTPAKSLGYSANLLWKEELNEEQGTSSFGGETEEILVTVLEYEIIDLDNEASRSLCQHQLHYLK